MKRIIITILAITGLILTILPSFLLFSGNITSDLNKQLMFIGFLLWFVVAPVWLKAKAKAEA